MSGNIAIGIQDFSTIIQGNYFYIDKTPFIKEWWDCGDSATLITRPHRFGKTLTMSMVEQFFSIDYAGRSDLFEHLAIWKEEKYRELQGTYPVISLSFARIKERDYEKTKQKMCEVLRNIYIKFCYIKDSEKLTDADRAYYERMLEENIKETDATSSLYQLSDFLYRYYGKKVIILLDEYDTPVECHGIGAGIQGHLVEVLEVIDIGEDAAGGGVVAQVVQHPVHLVKLPLGILVLHPQLIAVGLADGAGLVGPAVPDVAPEVVNVVGLLLPDPQQLVDAGLKVGAADSENGELPAQVVAVDDAEFLHRVGGGAVVPAGTDGLVRVPDAVFQDITAVLLKYFVGAAHRRALLAAFWGYCTTGGGITQGEWLA